MTNGNGDKDLVGEVVHYFDNIMVAVLDLKQDLKLGDRVRFVYEEEEFTQEIDSMEVDHETVESVEAGGEVAVKVEQPVKDNWKVYWA